MAGLHQRLVQAVHAAAPGRDPLVATLAAWSLVHGLAHLLQDRQLGERMGDGMSAEELSARVTELFVEGSSAVRPVKQVADAEGQTQNRRASRAVTAVSTRRIRSPSCTGCRPALCSISTS